MLGPDALQQCLVGLSEGTSRDVERAQMQMHRHVVRIEPRRLTIARDRASDVLRASARASAS